MTAPPKFQWGISTLGCHELNLTQVCTLAHQHHIYAMEIRSLADRLDLAHYLDETYKNAGEIQLVLETHQQRIVALNSSFSLAEAEDADRSEMLEYARWAEAMGIPFVRAFGRANIVEPLAEHELDQAAANLRWWHQVREENGWQTNLALENHGGFSSGRSCLRLQEHANLPLDIIWDTHHSWKMGNETLQETWDQIGPLVRHVHVKDSISVPSPQHPYSYVLPGTGEFPAHEALDLLARNAYEGIVSLEWERKWHPYLPPLDQALNALVSSGWRQETYIPQRLPKN
jgi:sugar phosphate isomerase/epimerase